MTRGPLGRILLVYDGSTVADRALGAALDRARESEGSITLLGVIPPRLWRARRGQFQMSPEKHDEEWVHAQLSRAHAALREAGVHGEELVRVGAPAAVIAEEAARGYDSVFMSIRPSLTGAPPLARLVAVPAGTEIVAVS
jgi:nucleotide-binding universal stress UspA family protein